MKRLLIFGCAALLIFALAATTYAVEFKMSGFVRNRTSWVMNVPGAVPGMQGLPGPTVDIRGFETNTSWDDTGAWADTRMRLKFDAVASEDLSGTIFFEADSTYWGEVQTDAGGHRNEAGHWGGDRDAVELKNMKVDFKVPGIPIGNRLHVGIQTFALRDHLLLFNDGAGVHFVANPEPVMFELMWGKMVENLNWQSDDSDMYLGRVRFALETIRFGAYGLYYDMNTYPLQAATGAGLNGGDDKADFYWIGGYGEGKVGPVNFEADLIFFTGDVKYQYGFNPALAVNLYNNPTPDLDFNGWVGWLTASVPLNMFEVGGGFMYATGADLEDWVKKGEYKGYNVPPNSEGGAGGFTQGGIFYPGPVQNNVGFYRTGGTMGFANRGDIGGTWMAKIFAAVKPLDWLKVTAYGMYIGDTTDSGNTEGNAVKANLPDPWTATGVYQARQDDSDIGIEFGLVTDIQIYKGLKFSMQGAYLLAGDALDQYSNLDLTPAGYVAGGTVAGAIPVNEEPKNPWMFCTNLTYSF